MAKKKYDVTAYSDLTPMIDCVFLLIIFFMCVTEMARVEFEQLTLPKANKAVEDVDVPKDRQVINVTYSIVNNSEVVSNIIIRKVNYNDQDKLVAFLKTRAEKSGRNDKGVSKLQVKIRADGRVAYQQVQRVMVACMKAGISQISFGAEPRKHG
jgi:biopolymer transport protein ExbD